jgi:phosphoadenosine phosphosulfate reductase
MQNAPYLAETTSTLFELTATFEHIKFASSLGAEDMVLAHIIQSHGMAIQTFTLDTGRLNPETYDLLARSQPFRIRVYFPQANLVEQFNSQY